MPAWFLAFPFSCSFSTPHFFSSMLTSTHTHIAHTYTPFFFVDYATVSFHINIASSLLPSSSSARANLVISRFDSPVRSLFKSTFCFCYCFLLYTYDMVWQRWARLATPPPTPPCYYCCCCCCCCRFHYHYCCPHYCCPNHRHRCWYCCRYYKYCHYCCSCSCWRYDSPTPPLALPPPLPPTIRTPPLPKTKPSRGREGRRD